ncbi:hypothetical protein [Clostridium tagluense]|nr:hypothetical protein [Clostridium tagluense]MBU3129075.1 hypothetical protein [Clostridium tagluense]
MDNQLTNDNCNMVYFENFIDLITEMILENINENGSNYINNNTKIA